MQPLPKLLNLEDILDCLKKSFHRPLLFLKYYGLSFESLDLLLGRLGESVCGNLELSLELAVAEYLHLVVLGYKTGRYKCIEIYDGNVPLLTESLKHREVHCLVLHSGGVLEAELGQTSLDRHLTALESDLVAVCRF